MYAPFDGLLALILGGMFLGVSLSALGLTFWWGGPERRLSLFGIIGRHALSAVSIFGILCGAYLLSLGTEHLLGDPLRRWGGAAIAPELWLALELYAREIGWSAAHTRRAGHRALSVPVWVGGALVWLAAKACMVLSGYVAIWAFLQY